MEAVNALERRALLSVVKCMNAAVGFVPPLLEFRRKNINLGLLDGAPAVLIAECHSS